MIMKTIQNTDAEIKYNTEQIRLKKHQGVVTNKITNKP